MERFTEAALAYAGLVSQIRPDQWARPGLGEWDLRDLVGHTSRSLLTVEAYLDQPAEQVDVETPYAYFAAVSGRTSGPEVAQRGRAAGAALGDDPAQAVDAIVERVLPKINRPDDPLITTIAGGMYLSAYLPTRTFELVVHGLDIARAADLAVPAYSAALLGQVAEIAAVASVLQGTAIDVILALTGRTSLPPGFSVV